MLTSGDATFAPGGALHGQDISQYWSFERHLPDRSRQVLLDYGLDMLSRRLVPS